MARAGEKRKKAVLKTDYGSFCLCCDPECDKAMVLLKKHNIDRWGYVNLPTKPKPESELKRKPKPSNIRARKMKSLRRQRMLKALPDAAATRANDERYSSNSLFRIASLHFHDEIFNLMKVDGKLSLIDSIPAETARRLDRDHGLRFTSTDKFDDGSYVPLPNVAPHDIVAAGEAMRSTASRVLITPCFSRTPTRSSPVTTESIEIKQIREELARQAAQSALQEIKYKAAYKELEERKKELEELRKDIITRQQNLDEKVHLLKCGDEIYLWANKAYTSEQGMAQEESRCCKALARIRILERLRVYDACPFRRAPPHGVTHKEDCSISL